MHKATGADATGALAEGSRATGEPDAARAPGGTGYATERPPGADVHHGPLQGSRPTNSSRTSGWPVLSRALDDREILLQKQSRVFFQISGAGHEILLVALARSLRPAYDWFFPYYRDRALVLALGVTPRDILLAGGGLVRGPGLGWSADAVSLGDVGPQHRHPVEPTGSQCLPAVGCAEAGRYMARRPGLPRAAEPTATRSPTCRSARGPRPKASSGRA